jgi:hypothetical protein
MSQARMTEIMENEVPSGVQVSTDRDITFANSALVNTQVTIDFTKPDQIRKKYELQVYNPSTITDLTVKVFHVEANVDSTNTRYSLVTSITIPKYQTVTGTAFGMYSTLLQNIFNGVNVRFVISNDTVLGGSDGFTAILRLKEL